MSKNKVPKPKIRCPLWDVIAVIGVPRSTLDPVITQKNGRAPTVPGTISCTQVREDIAVSKTDKNHGSHVARQYVTMCY